MNTIPKFDSIRVYAICGSPFELDFYQPAKLAIQLAGLTDNEKSLMLQSLDFQSRNKVIKSTFGAAQLPGSNFVKRSVCVVTYANGSGGWFPYFYSHYKNSQQVDSIFVITPKPEEFSGYALGGLISVDGADYNDYYIANLFSCVSNGLKSYYKYVLVCDVDELVVPAAQDGVTLKDFVDGAEESVFIALGIDVIKVDGESDFDFNVPITKNRAYGILNSAICKRYLSSCVICYCVGQHYCNYPVIFSPPGKGLVCYHMKWACAAVRSRVLGIVEKTNYAFDDIEAYSKKSVSVEIRHPAWNIAKNKLCEIESPEVNNFQERYIRQRIYNPALGVFSGSHFLGDFLVSLV